MTPCCPSISTIPHSPIVRTLPQASAFPPNPSISPPSAPPRTTTPNHPPIRRTLQGLARFALVHPPGPRHRPPTWVPSPTHPPHEFLPPGASVSRSQNTKHSTSVTFDPKHSVSSTAFQAPPSQHSAFQVLRFKFHTQEDHHHHARPSKITGRRFQQAACRVGPRSRSTPSSIQVPSKFSSQLESPSV
jgi:hypothetical protein